MDMRGGGGVGRVKCTLQRRLRAKYRGCTPPFPGPSTCPIGPQEAKKRVRKHRFTLSLVHPPHAFDLGTMRGAHALVTTLKVSAVRAHSDSSDNHGHTWMHVALLSFTPSRWDSTSRVQAPSLPRSLTFRAWHAPKSSSCHTGGRAPGQIVWAHGTDTVPDVRLQASTGTDTLPTTHVSTRVARPPPQRAT